MQRPDPLDLSDIEGATARQRTYRAAESHPFNSNSDIVGSTPNHMGVIGRFRPGRSTDPLRPQYSLPCYVPVELPPDPRPVRDIMWTVPQSKWKPETRHYPEQTSEEKLSKGTLFRRNVAARDPLRCQDITGPQFRTEEPFHRHTNPLVPTYVYDGGAVDDVNIKVPKHGCRYARSEADNYALRTKDISWSEFHPAGEYPKELIATRPANRTDDIEGAQANTRVSGPRLWSLPGHDPADVREKQTNKVWDIDGAVAGTGGQGLPLYRTRKQQAVYSLASSMPPRDFMSTFNAAARETRAVQYQGPKAAKAAAARQADIEAVAALK